MKDDNQGSDEAIEFEPPARSSRFHPLLVIGILAVLFYLLSVAIVFSAEPAFVVPGPHDRVTASPSGDAGPRLSWFRRMFHKPDWSELPAQCNEPRDVCRLVDRFVSYWPEVVDRWAPPAETWQCGRGDCEDFATCIEELCHQKGFDVSIRLYFPDGGPEEGHAVVVGMWNGRMWMASNGTYREVGSIADVKAFVARSYGCNKDDLWSSTLAHADVERFLARPRGPGVSQE